MTAKSSTRYVDSVLKLDGSLQFGYDFTIMRRGIAQLLDQGDRDIGLDLSEVETVDSSGIGELVHAFNQVSAEGGRLIVLNPPAKVEVLFQVAGLAESLMHGTVSCRSEGKVEGAATIGDKLGRRECWSPMTPAVNAQADVSTTQLVSRRFGPSLHPPGGASIWRPYLGRLMWS